MFGPEMVSLFVQLKQFFDPVGILNPNKIVDAPKWMTGRYSDLHPVIKQMICQDI